MTHEEIESYFDNEAKCQELLALFEQKFLQVDMIRDRMLESSIKTKQQNSEVLQESTGLFMELNEVYVLAETAKKKEEGREFFDIVAELEKNNQKVVSTKIEKEVSHKVQYLRRVRNIFKAKRDSAESSKVTCQSIGKYYQDPTNLYNGKEQ